MSTSLYKITHVADGKMYFGVAKDVAKRWSRHRSVTWGKRGGCPYLHAALMTHGLDAFVFEVVAVYPTTDEALAAEREHIAKYRTNDREFGYNLTDGGDYAPANGPEKTKKQWADPAIRAKMLDSIKRSWEIGRAERIEKIAAGQRKKVICVDTGEEFAAITDAAMSAGLSTGAVSSVLRGKNKTAGGKRWAFVGTDLSTAKSMEDINAEKAERRGAPKRKKIVCVDTGEEFESLRAAATKIGRCAVAICGVLKGKRKRAGGFRWAYADADPSTHVKLEDICTSKAYDGKPREVVCVETGETFPSVNAAAKSVGMTGGAISNVLKGRNKTAGGFRWAYKPVDNNPTSA